MILLSAAEVTGRIIPTFSPLIIVWAIILIFTLVFSITGGTGVIPDNRNFAVLITPFYLFIVAVFALMKDIVAIVPSMRGLEVGYAKAMSELASKLASNPKT